MYIGDYVPERYSTIGMHSSFNGFVTVFNYFGTRQLVSYFELLLYVYFVAPQLVI